MTREERLAEAGFKTGTIKELLDLMDEEMQTIELMLWVERKLWKALRKALRERDEARAELARHNGEASECPLCDVEAENARLRDLVAQVRALVSNTREVVWMSESYWPIRITRKWLDAAFALKRKEVNHG